MIPRGGLSAIVSLSMSDMIWGLLGGDTVAGARRTRALGLGAIVREFNERAVPGIGGVWFAKQVVLALIGVEIATRARESGKSLDNIRAANAVEALACVIGLQDNEWRGEPRLRGKSKMYGQTDLSFSKVSTQGFYVTQPMRMATVQALPALGLVMSSSSLFNNYRLSQRGRALIEATAHIPCHYSSTALDLLVNWALGSDYGLARNAGVRNVLSPLTPLNRDAAEILYDSIIQGDEREAVEDKSRRRAAIQWVERLRTNPSHDLGWHKRPSEISDTHWHDLKCGAAFFALRDAALSTLDQVEHAMGSTGRSCMNLTDGLDKQVGSALQELNRCAERFRGLSPNIDAATKFAQICVQKDPGHVLAELVRRDGRVLRLVGNAEIRPGSAYLGVLPWLDEANGGIDQLQQADEPTPESWALNWPEGISGRIPNLFLLNADLHADLVRWLDSAPKEEEA